MRDKRPLLDHIISEMEKLLGTKGRLVESVQAPIGKLAGNNIVSTNYLVAEAIAR